MRLILGLLAIVPAALCQLVPDDSDLPTVGGYTTILGTCDPRGVVLQSYSGRQGTLKACSDACNANTRCTGFNFVTDSNQCTLFGENCQSTIIRGRTEARQNFYRKGETECPRSTRGTEFYVAFMANRAQQPRNMPLEIWLTQDSTQDNITVKFEIDDSQTANFDMSLAGLDPTDMSIDVPYKAAIKILIPYTWKIKDGNDTAVVESKAIRVYTEEEKSFVLYGVNKEYYTADAFLGIPVSAAGNRYVANCHWPPFYNCEFAITPTTEDANTRVKITLPATPTRNVGGRPIPATIPTRCATEYNGRTYTNGDSFFVVLKQFQVLQVQDKCDLTGALIESDKPITVWSGDSRVNVGESNSRDHQVETLFSTNAWGTDCAAWPTPNRAAGLVDYWVITAANDSTVVKVESNEKAVVTYTLNAGQSVRFPANSVREWQRFSANKPFQAVQYAASAVDTSIPGDPSSTVCIPSDQFGFGYTFVTPTGVATTYTNFMTIVVERASTSGFLLDGKPITITNWQPFPNSTLVGGSYQLDRTKTQFRIEHNVPGTRFEAYIFGSGDRESIGYPTGACIKALGECTETDMVVGDGLDNDCDGVIDEELCDKIDNDYDGKVDEDCYMRKPDPPAPRITDRCPDVKVAQSCYGGQLELSCEGAEKIIVVAAHYGRLNRPNEMTCGAENTMDSCGGSDVSCGFSDIIAVVTSQCAAQTSCRLNVASLHRANNCPTCSLYAHVQYICANEREGNNGYLSGDNYQASSWLGGSLAADTCSASGSCSSSKANNNYHPSKADPFTSNAVEAWRPAACDAKTSWLQVDLGLTYNVGWYVISGCRRADYWITKFAISYSLDGETWTVIKDTNGDNKLFDGNVNSYLSKVCTLFQYNIVARWLRIHPVEWNGQACAHVDFGHGLYQNGCPVAAGIANTNLVSGIVGGRGTSVTVTCNPGWATARGETKYTLQCGADGQWSAAGRDCNQLLHCPDMPSIANGYTVGPNTRPGSTVSFRCNAGRTLRGASQATCRPDGTWSQPAPTCE